MIYCRWIPGFEGSYAISKYGDVFSMKRTSVRKMNTHTNWKGYSRIKLCNGAKHRKYTISRLVLQTYLSAPLEGMQCDHIDGDISNNYIGNLRWVTNQENTNNRMRLNKFYTRPSKERIRAVKGIYTHNGSVNEIASFFRESPSSVQAIRSGRNWGKYTQQLTKGSKNAEYKD